MRTGTELEHEQLVKGMVTRCNQCETGKEKQNAVS